MKTFKINDKTYIAKAFTFNTICDLEDMGLPIQEVINKPTAFMRAYLAICGNFSIEEAGNEIEAHIIAGGNVDELSQIAIKMMEESDFFRSLTENTEKKTPKSASKAKAEK